MKIPKTEKEIKAAYKTCFGYDCGYTDYETEIMLIGQCGGMELRPTELVRFCKLLGTDNMSIDTEKKECGYSEWTRWNEYWRTITIYTDYWGWLEDLKKSEEKPT